MADHERPLARRGRRAAKAIAKHLRAAGIEPELVLCSSAVRARETLELLEPALTGSTVRVEDALYGAGADDLLLWLQELPAELDSVLLIGHDPGLQELALSLARPGALRDDVQAKFPTAALATLALPSTWAAASEETAELTAFITPRSLG